MRALQVTELTGPSGVRVRTVAEPEVPGGALLIDVRAAGISYSDLLRTRGEYQERLDVPFTLGSEMSGVVLRAPAGSPFRVGDRVAAAVRGGAAERVVVPVDAAMLLPAHLTFEQGASIAFNYETAIVALELRGRLRPGETVLVLGAAGGTGTAAIQVAHAAGCRIIAVVSDDGKERVAREAGAGEVVRSDADWREAALRATGGRGVDLVFDPVGGDRALDCIRALRFGGRWVIVGFASSTIPQLPLNRVLLRNVDVVGAYLTAEVADPASRAHVRERLAELLASGGIRPIVGSIHPFANGAAALTEIADRRAVGKVVLTIAGA